MSYLQSLVRDVVSGNPDVLAAFVFDHRGRVDASSGASEAMIEAAVALCVPLRDMLDRAAASLGCGDMKSTLVLGSKASLGVSDIDGLRAVAVMGAEKAPSGALLQDARWLAERLREGRPS